MKTADMRVLGDFNAGVWERIYSNTLTTSATTVTISGLDGDTDVEYMLIQRIVGGSAAADAALVATFNNDTGNNYAYQQLGGVDTTAGAYRATAQPRFYTALWNAYIPEGGINFSRSIIYAKSGYARTVISEFSEAIVTTTVGGINSFGTVWNNTADNIVSIELKGTKTGTFGIGSVIELYRRRDAQ